MLLNPRIYLLTTFLVVLIIPSSGLAQIKFSFSADTSRISEPKRGSKQQTVAVQASSIPDKALTVTVKDMLTGDASGNLDYSLFPNPIVLTFGPGRQQTQTVTITIKSDTKVEPTETIDLALYVPKGHVIGEFAKHTIVIDDPVGATITQPVARTLTNPAPQPTKPPITFSFRTNSSEVAEPKTGNKTHLVQVEVSTIPDTTVQLAVKDLLTGDASPTIDYRLAPNPMTLTFGPGRQQSQAIAIELKADTKTEPVETINLSLSATPGYVVGTNGTHTVTVSDPEGDSLALPAIRLAVGSNFDYLNQAVALKNLFLGFEVFAPTAFQPKKTRAFLSGFHLGFAWSQNISSTGDGAYIPGGAINPLTNPGLIEQNGLYRTTTPIKRLGTDSTLVAYNFYTRNSIVNVNNFNFFASTMGRIWQSNDETVDAFFSIRFEGIQRNFTYNATYDLVAKGDTLPVRQRFGTIPPFDITKQQTRYASFYDFYLGVGLPFRWEPKADLVEIRLNPMIGAGWFSSPFHQDNDGKFNRIFYLVQLSIIEKKFGIRLGGEVRGSISNGKLAPYYTVTLSKVFTFKKFEDYFALKKN
ncbi:Calx-beta domain-containing protein [Fibrella arboris]|uniref:Calx-beta domain-containing protein n=1 Tax=Fibrella arboris TaxID=3242486 RepID=UPI00352134C5